MSTRVIREYVKFQRMMGLIILIGLGIIPILSLITFDIVLFHPYAALVSMVSGTYIYVNSRKYLHSGDVHDR
jgi:hypothetical protein